MANSWEYYEQALPSMGTPLFPLFTMPGLCNDGPSAGRFDEMHLLPNTIYAVPLDQMRAATVSQIVINLLHKDANTGAACELGIYQNASSTNNVPDTMVVDAGLITIDDTATSDMPSLSLSQALTADIRYWVVLFTNASVSNARIAALPQGASFPLGVVQNSSPGKGFCFWAARSIVLPNQPFTGSLPGTFPASALSVLNLAAKFPVPALALGFSSVT